MFGGGSIYFVNFEHHCFCCQSVSYLQIDVGFLQLPVAVVHSLIDEEFNNGEKRFGRGELVDYEELK